MKWRVDDGERCAILPGLNAYDATGALLGSVEAIDLEGGTMRIATNPFFEDPIVVPLNVITAVNARELLLSVTRAQHHTTAAEASGYGRRPH